MTDTATKTQTQVQVNHTLDPMAYKMTKDGKSVASFNIPAVLHPDEEMINLLMGSEALDDQERQYWFNLTDVMNDEQKGKLRDILTREKTKLAEIYEKYGKKQPVNPKEAARQAELAARKRQSYQDNIKQREAAQQTEESKMEDTLIDGAAWE
jgi:hypothetical protein